MLKIMSEQKNKSVKIISKHTEVSAINSLLKKRDIVEIDKMLIVIKKDFKRFNDLGNGSWRRIDFLCNHLGYRCMYE